VGWISELGPVIVGVGGLAFAFRERTLTLKHERTLSDLDAVRSVLEQGAVHLHHVSYALDEARTNLQTRADAHRGAIESLGRRYDELSERMKVRLGPEHEATEHFVSANEAVLEIYRALGMILLEDPADTPETRRERGAFIGNQRTRIETARSMFDEERTAYVAAAARAAGARLP
jgi:hypothetical protein